MAKRTLTGVVTSAKRDKTITVTVTSRETHPIYGKQYTVNRKYTAHDPNNQAGEGDTVTIVEKSRGTIEIKEEAAEEEAV